MHHILAQYGSLAQYTLLCSIMLLGFYFDLSKAFDAVDHSILLHKLYYNGVRGTAFNWFKDYLSNRKQYTCVGNVNSSLSDIV